MEIFNFDYIVM